MLYIILFIIVGVLALTPSMHSHLFVDTSFIFIIIYSFYNIFKRNQPPYSLRKMFNIFSFFFFGIAPWLQYQNNTRFWGLSHINESSYIITNCILILSLITYNFVYLKYTNTYVYTGKESVKLRLDKVSNINTLTYVIISFIAFFIVFASKNFDFLNLMFRGIIDGNASSSSQSPKSLALIISNFIRPIPVVIFLYYVINKNKNIVISLILFGLALVTLSPTGVPRLMAASMYIPILLVLVPFFKRANNFSISFIAGLLIIFPFLNNFRRFDSDATLNLGLNFDMFLEGHFDAYQMFLNVINIDYISYGRQLLGSVFFFVPRSIWVSKPYGSGATIADEMGFFFDNLSMPLVAEGYINFGFLGSILFMILLAITTSKLDIYYWKNKDIPSRFYIQYLILIGMVFFLLRGDLMNGIAYTSGIMCSVYFISKIITPKR